MVTEAEEVRSIMKDLVADGDHTIAHSLLVGGVATVYYIDRKLKPLRYVVVSRYAPRMKKNLELETDSLKQALEMMVELAVKNTSEETA